MWFVFLLGFWLGGALVMSFVLKLTSRTDDAPSPWWLFVLCVMGWPSTLFLVVRDEQNH